MNGTASNLPNYKLKHTLTGHDLGAVSVKFSPGGAWLASASADGSVKIWDPHAGKLVRTLKGHAKVCNCHCQQCAPGLLMVAFLLLMPFAIKLHFPSELA